MESIYQWFRALMQHCPMLIWIQKGSQRSRRDFRGIFRNCASAQQALIRIQAASLGMAGLLNEVQLESDEIR